MDDTQGRRLDDRLPVVIEDGITLTDLIDRVAAARGKPMRVVELPELSKSGSLCGMWLATDTEDIVLHAPSESALHRGQFILHELAHMILRHDEITPAASAAPIIADIDVAAVNTVLTRNRLGEQLERDAEILADELAAVIRRQRRRARSRFMEVFG